MTLLLWVVVLPFCMWVWWGIAYAIARTLIAVVTLVVTEELTMKQSPEHKYARLIRYTAVADDEHPHLLSIYDPEKNIQMIDHDLVNQLPLSMRNRLETSVIPATMVVDDGFGLRFEEYRQ